MEKIKKVRRMVLDVFEDFIKKNLIETDCMGNFILV